MAPPTRFRKHYSFMSATTFSDLDAVLTFGGQEHEQRSKELDRQYRSILRQQQIGWTSHYRLLKPIGSGGQGIVYLSRRRGADNFTLPIAIKIFSPEKYHDTHSYEDDMARLARVGARVAQIQEEHLLSVHDFVDRNRCGNVRFAASNSSNLFVSGKGCWPDSISIST